MAITMADEVMYDVRLVERHISKGLVDRKNYTKWMKDQEDLTEQVIVVDYEHLTSSGALRRPRS